MKSKDAYYVDRTYTRDFINTNKLTGVQQFVVCGNGKNCNFAHNAIQLDLTPMTSKIKNLGGVVKAQQHKLKNDKPLEPWRPSAKNFTPGDLPDNAKK